MNYCKDCKFYVPAGGVFLYGAGAGWPHSCRKSYPEPFVRSMITGEILDNWTDPNNNRQNEEGCGIEGRWFELKPIPIQTPENTEKMAADISAENISAKVMLNNVVEKAITPKRKWWDIFS